MQRWPNCVRQNNMSFAKTLKFATKKFSKPKNRIVDLKIIFLVTSIEARSSYEKLFSTFDFTAWILLVAKFFLAFLTIFFIINCSYKTLQNFMYSNKVVNSMLNIISIFSTSHRLAF